MTDLDHPLVAVLTAHSLVLLSLGGFAAVARNFLFQNSDKYDAWGESAQHQTHAEDLGRHLLLPYPARMGAISPSSLLGITSTTSLADALATAWKMRLG